MIKCPQCPFEGSMPSDIKKHMTIHTYSKCYIGVSAGQCNKDHQRMMVDPMLLIVQSLWSFVTAVTTTAVAPIPVIFTCNLPEYTYNYLNLYEFT